MSAPHDRVSAKLIEIFGYDAALLYACLDPDIEQDVLKLAERSGLSVYVTVDELEQLCAKGFAYRLALERTGWLRGTADIDLIAAQLGVFGPELEAITGGAGKKPLARYSSRKYRLVQMPAGF